MSRATRAQLMSRCLALTAIAWCTATLVATPAESGTAGHARAEAKVPHWKVWLCRPGQRLDYCNADLEVTLVNADGSRQTAMESNLTERPIDCFYAYPTVSGANANLTIDQPEKQVAVIQASRFGQVCRVFAPLYRQGGDGQAYHDLAAAWHDYLAHYNHGRGVVLVGHSQGSFVLADLIRAEIERAPSVRKRLVSAILLGGNITVRKGSDTGGSFRRLPACRAKKQSGCVVAYSTWGRTPPKDASFERVANGRQQVLCVNPAAPAGGRAPITPVFPWFAPQGIITSPLVPQVETLWVGFPDLYTARCVRNGSRAWLLVESVARPADPREFVREIAGPSWGLHVADMNIALHELVDLVRAQGKTWAASR